MVYFRNMTSAHSCEPNRVYLSVALILAVSALASCSNGLLGQKPKETVRTKIVRVGKPAKPKIPKPAPLALGKLKWKVTTGPDGKTGDLVCLTPKDYETLSRNMAELQRYVAEANKQLDYYRK